MSDARVLDAPWLRSGPSARVLKLLNGDGEEARVVGGAVRNALLEDSDRRHRYRDHRAARRSGPPRQGGRHQERADRYRARHRDAGGRRAAVRGHDAARGYRDVRPQGQGGVRPRLGRRCRAARLHHQRPVGRRRWRRARLRRRACGHCRSSACASSATRRSGSPRTICASSGSFAFTPPSARASPIAPAISPASSRAPALRRFVRGAGAHGDDEADGRRWRRPARSKRWRMAACCCRSSAASPIPGRLRR